MAVLNNRHLDDLALFHAVQVFFCQRAPKPFRFILSWMVFLIQIIVFHGRIILVDEREEFLILPLFSDLLVPSDIFFRVEVPQAVLLLDVGVALLKGHKLLWGELILWLIAIDCRHNLGRPDFTLFLVLSSASKPFGDLLWMEKLPHLLWSTVLCDGHLFLGVLFNEAFHCVPDDVEGCGNVQNEDLGWPTPILALQHTDDSFQVLVRNLEETHISKVYDDHPAFYLAFDHEVLDDIFLHQTAS